MKVQLPSHQRISRPILIAFGLFCLLAILTLQNSFYILPTAASRGPAVPISQDNMGIIHVVMFEFKPEAKAEQIQDVCERMLALKTACLSPVSNRPYLRSMIGGRENSPEGKQKGITHVFVAEFENEEDRKYYLEQDPAHLAFVKSVGEVVKDATVVDFIPGQF